MSKMNFKYVRIQGKELARNTMHAKGIFSMCWQMIQQDVMTGENAEEMLKMIRPAMWLLERYNHPYYVVYTNTPGEIVYEDKYQIAAKADGYLRIDELQPSWSPKETE